MQVLLSSRAADDSDVGAEVLSSPGALVVGGLGDGGWCSRQDDRVGARCSQGLEVSHGRDVEIEALDRPHRLSDLLQGRVPKWV